MKRILVIPTSQKSEEILRSNTDKFGIGKFQSKVLKRVGDKYTTTELLDNPFCIVITVKAEYEKYIDNKTIIDKVFKVVEKIMIEHNGSIHDVNIEVKDD